jgi:hypothetical protein
MKEISLFDKIGQLQLQAIEQDDTPVARFSRKLSLPHRQLHEVWVLPAQGRYFTTDDVEKMHFREIDKVIDLYDPELSGAPIHAMAKQIDLVQTFAINLAIDDARFDYSILRFANRPILSIVFGSRQAMSLVYAKGLREKKFAGAETDECSD